MPEFQTAGGNTVAVNAAPWRDAVALKNAIAKEFLASGAVLDLKADASNLSKVILAVDSSDAVYKALMACLSRCTFNNQKIVDATFENESAREDYYEIVTECLKVNLSPFFKGLLLKLKTLESLLPNKDSPKLTLPT
jgi:hypothetical protein